jgi:hypothetical protein
MFSTLPRRHSHRRGPVMSEGCLETSKQRQHQSTQSRALQCWRSASGDPCNPPLPSLGCPPLLSQIIDTGVGIYAVRLNPRLSTIARDFWTVWTTSMHTPSLAAALGDLTPVVLAKLAIRPLLLSTLHACSPSLHQRETRQGGRGRSMPTEVWRCNYHSRAETSNSRPVGSA